MKLVLYKIGNSKLAKKYESSEILIIVSSETTLSKNLKSGINFYQKAF